MEHIRQGMSMFLAVSCRKQSSFTMIVGLGQMTLRIRVRSCHFEQLQATMIRIVRWW